MSEFVTRTPSLIVNLLHRKLTLQLLTNGDSEPDSSCCWSTSCCCCKSTGALCSSTRTGEGTSGAYWRIDKIGFPQKVSKGVKNGKDIHSNHWSPWLQLLKRIIWGDWGYALGIGMHHFWPYVFWFTDLKSHPVWRTTPGIRPTELALLPPGPRYELSKWEKHGKTDPFESSKSSGSFGSLNIYILYTYIS